MIKGSTLNPSIGKLSKVGFFVVVKEKADTREWMSTLVKACMCEK